MSDRPYPGESLDAFRARRKSEMAGGPTPESGFEAQKAKVAAQHGKWEQGASKRAVNLDTAASDDEGVNATHKRLAGGVKVVDKAAADAAYKADAGFAKKSETEQQDAARGAKAATTPGAAHTTETPGASHQTSMGAALAKAGVSGSPSPAPKEEAKPRRAPSAPPSPDVAARNNMGAPRVQDNGASVVAGRTVDPGEAAAAKAAAGRGQKKNGGVREKAAAPARTSVAPQAPAAVAQSKQLPQGRFASKPRAEMFAHALGLEHGDSMAMSSKPPVNVAPAAAGGRVRMAAHDNARPGAAVNAAPQAPVAQSAAPAPTMTPSSRGRFESTDSVTRESIGVGKPKLGVDITYGVDKATGPTAKTREAYNAHIAGGGNTDTYWAQRDAKKAAKTAKAPAPKAAVSETPAVVAPKATPPSAPAPVAKAAPSAPAAPRTPVSSTPPANTGLGLHTKVAADAAAAKATSRAQSAPAGPTAGPPKINPTQAAAASGGAPTPPQARSTGRVVTEEAPSVREASPGTRTAARAGGVSGGEGSVNIGGDNHGVITNNHNTYNVNYGHVGGSMGNVEHGYAPRGGGHTGGGGGHGGSGGHGGGHASHGGDIWVRDASGTHSLRGTLDHVSGRTNGHGVKTPQAVKADKARSAGGQQSPLTGSARSSVNPAQTPNAGTGTTSNWQGPQAGVTHPASGIGTAAHGQQTP